MLRLVIVSLALIGCSASATNVKRCRNGQPFPLSVEIEGCDQPPCNVVKGTTATMNVHFLGIKDNTQALTAKVRATTLGITVPYKLPEDVANVCGNLMDDAECPIDKDEDVVYKFQLYVDKSYPEIGVKVEVDLKDDENASVACFVCDIRVRKSAKDIRPFLA